MGLGTLLFPPSTLAFFVDIHGYDYVMTNNKTSVVVSGNGNAGNGL